MTSTRLKQEGIEQSSAHNPVTLETVLNEISIMRKCRLRIDSKYIGVRHDEVFSVEGLIDQINLMRTLLGKDPIPHSLNGAIGYHARKRGYICGTGRLMKASRNERRDNKVEECCWKPDL